MKIGTRVGAILCAKATGGQAPVVDLLGFGEYLGDEVPDEQALGGLAEDCRAAQIPNPKIRLDSGKIVWGCECWWGSEKMVRKMLEGAVVVERDIDEARREYDG